MKPPPPTVGRNVALDFAKGALVLCMVVYHSVNYFGLSQDVLKYLHFLPSSFIFITGFLVSGIYLVKYDVLDTRLSRRLLIRGFKLLIIFVVLNLTANALFKSNYNQGQLGLASFRKALVPFFITGKGEATVFEVLLPISYLLMISGLLLKVCRICRYFLQIVSGSAVVFCLILACQDRLVFNSELLSMGLLGVLAGFIPMQEIERIAGHLPAVIVIYLAYLAVISLWYPVYALNIVGVCLTLVLLYGIGVKWGDSSIASRIVVLLGKYSLLAYIVQIGVLQALFRALRHLGSSEAQLTVAFVATTILTGAVIGAVDSLRTRWVLVNRLYKSAFA